MQDKSHKDLWWDKMIAKHGSREAVSEFMRQSQVKSRQKYSGTGGFAKDRDFARQMSKKALEARWGKDGKNDT